MTEEFQFKSKHKRRKDTGAWDTGAGARGRGNPIKSYQLYPTGTGRSLFPYSKGLKRSRQHLSGAKIID